MIRTSTHTLRRGWRFFPLLALLLLSGCAAFNNPLWILNPNGPIADASVFYLVVDILLLLIIIVPATVLVLWVAIRYRRGGGSRYQPTFTHSKLLEVAIWGVPILVVGGLSYYTVEGAYAVDPYDPTVLNETRIQHDPKPLKISVITTDWQWLFVYPRQGVALANKLVLPTGRKIDMQLTSAAVTNDFYILKLVSQIYIMPGMRTERHFLADRPGQYWGFSTEFSGPGFAWMDYNVDVVRPKQFQQWVAKAKRTGQPLSYARFKKFAQPTVNVGNVSQVFNHVDPNLFTTVIRRVKSGQLTHRRPLQLTEDMDSRKFKSHAN